MKKSLTFAAVSAFIALGSVSWASTNLNSIKSSFENEVVSSSQPAALAAQSIKAGQANKSAAQTIVICKKTIPAGGTGFPFSWANGFGSLPPFTLDDGQCITKNMTGQDHYNKFTENVPAGWTLTNISCVKTTTPLQIIGANSNPAFQPGDNTVTMDLNEANVTCTFVNQASGSSGNDCKGNLVTNGNFMNGLNGWSTVNGTPDYASSMGALDPGFVGMWGNLNPTIGEGLQQNLGANQLVSGKTYLVTLQVRRLNDPNKLPYANFKVRASTAPLSSGAGGITVGRTGNITATTWTPVSFTWTAPAGGPFPFLAINVENNSTVNHGSQTSYGHFDNICIREIPSLPCCECLGKVTTLDLSTISSNNWTVTDPSNATSPVVPVSPIHSAWNLNTGPAKWVSTSATGGSANLVGGTYDYKLNFEVPRCAIERKVTLSGNYGGDDDVFVYLDNTTPLNLISQCTQGWCFNTNNTPPPFSNYAIPAGSHTLIVRVVNSSKSPTGMFINAKLTGTCVSQ